VGRLSHLLTLLNFGSDSVPQRFCPLEHIPECGFLGSGQISFPESNGSRETKFYSTTAPKCVYNTQLRDY
jgi:hypothetical protein